MIDTGATGSFLPSNGIVCRNIDSTQLTTTKCARTVTNDVIPISFSVKLPTRSRSIDKNTTSIDYYIIDQLATNLLGHSAILGLNAIKQMNMKIRKHDHIMKAYINDIEIGQENSEETYMLAAVRIKDRLKEILDEFDGVFAENVSSCIIMDPMTIPLLSNTPVKAKLRRQSVEDILEMEKQVNRLKENNIIEKSTSPFSSSCHLVPKKNNQKRLVVNFIPLNQISCKDVYPLPQLQDLFGALRGAKFFCTLDCTEGFFQVPILKEHRERTAFITPFGLYQFRRCPFGYTNSPAVFQRMMNDIFREGLYKKVVIYIDDILVFGKTENEVLDNLLWVLDRCRERSIQLKKSKCQFMLSDIEFLGFKVSENHIGPITGKLDHIMQCVPKTKTDILMILGTFNFYSRFISEYSDKTKFLRDLAKQSKVEWGEIELLALKKIHDELESAIEQTIPDNYEPKIIELNITLTSIEASCVNETGHLINRASAVLSSTQQNYTQVEKALLGLILAYKKFGSFLKGPVTIITHCKQLERILSMKEKPIRVQRLLLDVPPDADYQIRFSGLDKSVESLKTSDAPPDEIFYTDGACCGNGGPQCKASWAVLATQDENLSETGIVSGYKPSNQVAELIAVKRAIEISIRHKMKSIVIVTDSKYAFGAITVWIQAWKSNGWKDTRGKTPINIDLLKSIGDLMKLIDVKALHVKAHGTDSYNQQVDDMAKQELHRNLGITIATCFVEPFHQENDTFIENMKTKLSKNKNEDIPFTVTNGVLYYIDPSQPLHCRKRIVVPKSSQLLLLKQAHDNFLSGGHFGRKKTRSKLDRFYWPHMTRDIDEYIRSCDVCQRIKRPRGVKPGLLHPIKVSQVFELTQIDIVGPLKRSSSGTRYIVTAIDAFSRYAFVKAEFEVTTRTIIEFIENDIISKHGKPEKLLSDNGPQFASREFKKFLDGWGIKHHKTSTYHPESNGRNERFNGTLINILKNYIDGSQLDWSEKLKWAVWLYNITKNESTQMSPYCVLFGLMPRTPLTFIPRNENDESEQSSSHDEIRNAVLEDMMLAQQRQKENHDKGRKSLEIAVLDQVLLEIQAVPRHLSKKFAPYWDGPYTVLSITRHDEEVTSAVVVNMATLSTRRVNIQNLKPYVARLVTGSEDGVGVNNSTARVYHVSDEYDPLNDFPMLQYPGGDESQTNKNQDIQDKYTNQLSSTPLIMNSNDQISDREFDPSVTRQQLRLSNIYNTNSNSNSYTNPINISACLSPASSARPGEPEDLINSECTALLGNLAGSLGRDISAGPTPSSHTSPTGQAAINSRCPTPLSLPSPTSVNDISARPAPLSHVSPTVPQEISVCPAPMIHVDSLYDESIDESSSHSNRPESIGRQEISACPAPSSLVSPTNHEEAISSACPAPLSFVSPTNYEEPISSACHAPSSFVSPTNHEEPITSACPAHTSLASPTSQTNISPHRAIMSHCSPSNQRYSDCAEPPIVMSSPVVNKIDYPPPSSLVGFPRCRDNSKIPVVSSRIGPTGFQNTSLSCQTQMNLSSPIIRHDISDTEPVIHDSSHTYASSPSEQTDNPRSYHNITIQDERQVNPLEDMEIPQCSHDSPELRRSQRTRKVPKKYTP